MVERNNNFDFDFTPIGQAIKKVREARGMTREQLSGIIGFAPRHIQAIENEGQYPSIELFIQLITMFDVSVGEYIFPNEEVKKSSVRRRLDAEPMYCEFPHKFICSASGSLTRSIDKPFLDFLSFLVFTLFL